MIEQAQVGSYVIEFDRESTADAYSRIAMPDPEECGCAHCRNWVAGRESIMTNEVRDFLARFGIPTNGEIDVTGYPSDTRPHGYHGIYLFVGRIVSAPMNSDVDVGGFHFWFLGPETCPTLSVPAFDGRATCELWFSTSTDEYLTPEDYA